MVQAFGSLQGAMLRQSERLICGPSVESVGAEGLGLVSIFMGERPFTALFVHFRHFVDKRFLLLVPLFCLPPSSRSQLPSLLRHRRGPP